MRRATPSSPPTRTSTRRSSACSAPWAGRSTRGARGTTRLRRRCASTSSTLVRKPGRGSPSSPRPPSISPNARRARSSRATPPAGTTGHARPPSPRLGGDARARPVRFAHAAEQAGPSPSARERWRARPCRSRRRPASRRGIRSTPSPTGTSRSTTCTRAPCCSATCPGSGGSCSGAPRSSASSSCRRTRRPARRRCPRS